MANIKRTKIVCTIGPATNTVVSMVKLGKMGMDVARLNFSHGTHADHARLFTRLNQAGRMLRRPFGILGDLQGPKIRIGDISKKGVKLVKGKVVIFSTEKKMRAGDIPVTLPELHRDVKAKEHILFDDGLLEVVVKKVVGRRIFTEVVQGGLLLPHKGLNLPGTKLRIPALSEKDRADARFAAHLGVDFVALSFVRSANDVKDLRKLLNSCGPRGKRIQIIAKIEKQEAVDAFDEILPLCDAIMVARGDLGVETAAESVPVVQKMLIAKCRERGTPVIVATQMLDSMQRNPRPTRAEVSDVANAVADHADAVMLSGETASGNFPVEAVRVMAETIRMMEATPYDDVTAVGVQIPSDAEHALAIAARTMIDAMQIRQVVLHDPSLNLVRRLSSLRPETRLLAAVRDVQSARIMRLAWGVEAYVQVLNRHFSQPMNDTKMLLMAGVSRVKREPFLSIRSDRTGMGMDVSV